MASNNFPNKQVCVIETEKGTGSGFHIGDGFIVTNAHVLTNPNKTKIIFKGIGNNGSDLIFANLPRFALRYKIKSDGLDQKDLAILKLGKQGEYGRITFFTIETEEEEKVKLLECVRYQDEPNLKADDEIIAMYYLQGVQCVERGKYTKTEEGLIHHTARVRPGSSGSPIFSNNKFCGVTVGAIFDDDISKIAVDQAIVNKCLQEMWSVYCSFGKTQTYEEAAEQHPEFPKGKDIAKALNNAINEKIEIANIEALYVESEENI